MAQLASGDVIRMLDKSTYYHGAAVIPILEDARCRSIRKLGSLGYVLNDDIFLFIKYTTKERSPWRFTFDQEDVDRSAKMAAEYRRLVFGFVCGSDGVCAIDGLQGRDLLGNKPGWIAASRKHNHSYTVWGAGGELKRKISLGQWPALLFDIEASETANAA
ncbi:MULTISPECIES: hypothetical protein [unclassified Bradyrhizobium]|uniref:hypothetical protein n=1 Tax=unclassified Bradyrhizobium TaxID=2631580 RepID=UPI002916F55D|nr:MULTISPECIES: hypothetical protein [unclassified Bradyrhizobium]